MPWVCVGLVPRPPSRIWASVDHPGHSLLPLSLNRIPQGNFFMALSILGCYLIYLFLCVL